MKMINHNFLDTLYKLELLVHVVHMVRLVESLMPEVIVEAPLPEVTVEVAN